MRRLRVFVLAALAAAAPMALLAQEAGDPLLGRRLARGECAACHAVEPGEAPSPNLFAPTFTAVATTSGISAMALYAFLQTPHADMPDFVLKPDETRDVVAYILSLQKGR